MIKHLSDTFVSTAVPSGEVYLSKVPIEAGNLRAAVYAESESRLVVDILSENISEVHGAAISIINGLFDTHVELNKGDAVVRAHTIYDHGDVIRTEDTARPVGYRTYFHLNIVSQMSKDLEAA